MARSRSARIPADVSLLLSLLAAAVLEEIVFRAGLHEALLRRAAASPLLQRHILGCSAPNLFTALAFALAHLVFRPSAVAAAALPAGLLLGWLYERYRRLWPCIAAHAAMNCLWLLAAPWAVAFAPLP